MHSSAGSYEEMENRRGKINTVGFIKYYKDA